MLRVLSFVGAAALHGAASPIQKQPHILLIVADDYGYNDIGYHQNQESPANPTGARTTNAVIKTPNLDRLASEGMRLENYYVQPLCSPTRATIMTGRYASHTGLGPSIIKPNHAYGLPANETLIPQVLNKAGYASHMVGKWHLGLCDERFTPTFRGFESFKGYLLGAQDYYAHTRVDNGYQALDFRVSSLQSANQMPPASNASFGVYSSDVFTARVHDIVKDHVAKYGADGKPLFVYLPYQSVHGPLEAPQKYIDMYKESISDMDRRTYAGMVTALDVAVGEVEQMYKDHGLWDSTVLIFTTDNGGPLGSANNFPLRGHKATTWEGGVLGNAFVRGASNFKVPAGTITRQLMHSTDWLPTIAAIAGASTEGTLPLDGHNIWPVLSQTGNTTRTSVVHNCPGAGEPANGAYRSGDFKLLYAGMNTKPDIPQTPPPGFKQSKLICDAPKPVHKGGSRVWLFNIAEDPNECTNLAGEAKFASTLQRLEHELAEYQKTAVDDLAIAHGKNDPTSHPRNRPDKAWGPFPNSKMCTYGRMEEYVV